MTATIGQAARLFRPAGSLVRVIWISGGVLAGVALGVVAGFAVALAVAQFHPRNDGTYGMREMLVCLPCGALVGLVAGLFWALRP